MRIAVIGATGMVGSRVVAEAADRGHEVTAVSRSAPQDQRRQVTPRRGDAGAGADLDAVLGEAEAAVLTIRAIPGHEDSFITSTEAVLAASARAGIPALIVGGAGPLQSPNNPELLVIDDPSFVPSQWRQVAAASVAQLRACQKHSNKDWTYLSPPAVLEPGARTGVYRRGTTTLLRHRDGSSSISAEDLAVAIVDELESPGTERRITLARQDPGPRRITE